MNKRDLIDAISGRLGDKKSATEAVNAVLETIQSAVAAGDKTVAAMEPPRGGPFAGAGRLWRSLTRGHATPEPGRTLAGVA